MVLFPTLTDVFDAGAFYQTEDIVFPNKEAIEKNLICVDYTLMTEEENDKTTTQKKTTKYLWEGNRVKKITR